MRSGWQCPHKRSAWNPPSAAERCGAFPRSGRMKRICSAVPLLLCAFLLGSTGYPFKPAVDVDVTPRTTILCSVEQGRTSLPVGRELRETSGLSYPQAQLTFRSRLKGNDGLTRPSLMQTEGISVQGSDFIPGISSDLYMLMSRPHLCAEL
ncbi:UNVERIFIED_CONTAM: hypothetical protein FKN15_030157 [Acipenser sinensis]